MHLYQKGVFTFIGTGRYVWLKTLPLEVSEPANGMCETVTLNLQLQCFCTEHAA